MTKCNVSSMEGHCCPDFMERRGRHIVEGKRKKEDISISTIKRPR